jgi:hypothetical protein
LRVLRQCAAFASGVCTPVGERIVGEYAGIPFPLESVASLSAAGRRSFSRRWAAPLSLPVFRPRSPSRRQIMLQGKQILQRVAALSGKTSLRDLLRLLSPRRRRARVAGLDDFVDFLHGRSAYMAQSTLFGYLRTRMGVGFQQFFEDERFSAQIADARLHVFVACLGDLTIFAVALAAAGGRLEARACARAAERCFGLALDRALDPGDRLKAAEAPVDFSRRARSVDWAGAHLGEAAFTASPAMLSQAAPVSDRMRRADREIVMNSMRFHWREVRDELRRALDAEAVAAALTAPTPWGAARSRED